MEGPYQIAGSRWVATRELKDLRWPEVGRGRQTRRRRLVRRDLLGPQGQAQGVGRVGQVQVHHLYSNGRGFPERTHVHTANFDYVGVGLPRR